ncbi:hypothetical protein ACOMHN_012882 [Nucella lapillus]
MRQPHHPHNVPEALAAARSSHPRGKTAVARQPHHHHPHNDTQDPASAGDCRHSLADLGGHGPPAAGHAAGAGADQEGACREGGGDVPPAALLPPSNHPVSLTLLRQAKEGDGHADTLADVSEGGLVVYKLDKGDSKFYTATGQRDTYLQLVMSRASCHESTYNYICKSRLLRSNQTSVSLFAAMAELPRPILKARSTQEVYTDSQHLTLTCEINSPIGLVTDHAQGQWVWEYNDVGPWKPAERSDISTLQATTEGCFQSSGFTRIKVRVKDLAHCWRLFRCYTRTPVSRAADNAAEFMVSRGIDCEKSSIQGAKPAVAILTVLLVITFLTALVTYLFRTSSRLRITFKEEEKQSMGTMLLSPMSDQQRNRLVEEQMHQHHVSTTPATYGVLKRTVPTSSDRLDDKASFEVAMRKMSSPLPLKSFLKTSPARTTSPANNTDSMQPLLATEDSSFSTSVFDSSTYVSSYESETTSEAPSEATSEATSDAQP